MVMPAVSINMLIICGLTLVQETVLQADLHTANGLVCQYNILKVILAAQNYGDYGAIMMFNVRDTDASGKMNMFAPYVWGGKRVCWTGVSHPKNY